MPDSAQASALDGRGPWRTDPRRLQPTVNGGQPWAAGDTRWLAGTDGPERQRWGFQDQPAEPGESSDISAGSCDPRVCVCRCIPEGGLGPGLACGLGDCQRTHCH